MQNPMVPLRRLAAWLPLAAGLLAAEASPAQESAQDCWAAVRMLAGLIADPPHGDLAVAHYTSAHRHLTRARSACSEGNAVRALREAERGIRRLQAREAGQVSGN